MATAVSLNITGLQPLLRSLDQLPDAMRMRVLLPAAKNAGQIIERAIAPLIPVQRFTGRRGRKAKGKMHYRNAMTHAVRDYPATSSVVTIVGAESGKAPHAHLVEDGTAPRFTNHKTRYKRVAVGQRWVIKNGKAKQVDDRQRVSDGSHAKKNKRKANYRGQMPAFKPVARGVAACQSSVASRLKSDITTGITSELTAAKLSRGK